MSVVDTTRVKLHSLDGDDDLPVRSSPYPPSPPPSQGTTPVRGSTIPVALDDTDDRANTSDGVSPMGVRFSRTAGQESADTTISELNVRRVTRREEDEESLRSSLVVEDGSSETREFCGVTLRR